MMSTPVVLTVILPLMILGIGAAMAYRARGLNLPKNALSIAIMIFAFVFSSLSGVVGMVLYYNANAVYDGCIRIVDRSVDLHKFDDTLVAIVKHEVTDRPDISQQLQDALVPPQHRSDCDALKP